MTVATATRGRTAGGAELPSQSTMDGLRPLTDPFHPGEVDGNLEVIDEEDSSVVSAENNFIGGDEVCWLTLSIVTMQTTIGTFNKYLQMSVASTPAGPGSPLVENRPLRERTPAPEDHGYSLDVHPSLQFLSGLIDQLRTRIENLEIEMARIRNTVGSSFISFPPRLCKCCYP